MRPRVLAVEDNPDTQIVLRYYLGRQDAFEWELADSAEAGLDRFALAHAEGRPFDLIVLDWMMPLMDGFEVGRRIREKDATVRLVLLTVYDDPEMDDHLGEIQALGIEELWRKPTGTLEIVQRVCRVLKIEAI